MKSIIYTQNKEIYEKFSSLPFTREIELVTPRRNELTKIMNNVNRKGKVLEMFDLGDKFVIKKINTTNFGVYLKRTKNG